VVAAVAAAVVAAVVDFTAAEPGPASTAAELVVPVAEGVLAWAEEARTGRIWEVEARAGRILAVAEEDRGLVAVGRGQVWRMSIAPAAAIVRQAA